MKNKSDMKYERYHLTSHQELDFKCYTRPQHVSARITSPPYQLGLNSQQFLQASSVIGAFTPSHACRVFGGLAIGAFSGQLFAASLGVITGTSNLT
jgi:hypothetical protein